MNELVKMKNYASKRFTITILVIIGVMICTLLISENFMGEVRHLTFSTRKQSKFRKCQMDLRYNSGLPLNREGCQRVIPDKGSCLLAKDLFFSSSIHTCKHQHNIKICQITELLTGELNLNCSDGICANNVVLGEPSNVTGGVEWKEFASTKHLEAYLQNIFDQKNDHYGFYFIKCAKDVYNSSLKNIQQLLIVPPFVHKIHQPETLLPPGINFNIMLLDSVSHSHFLRSMPKSLHMLRQLKNVSVFNFELFQSLKGRTYENLQALFSGKLSGVESPFEYHEIPPTPLNFKRLLSGFKNQGFETMYTEDLCWQGKWGLVRNLLAYMPDNDIKTRWKNLKTFLKNAGIDRIDLTLTSCEILKENNIEDPFFGPPAICYNGKYQHHYILDYLGKRQSLLETNDQRFFHNTLLNVGHDDFGQRIQTLDEDLADYIKTVSEFNNTFTIILSDHGNSYGEYVKSEEGRIELFHPHLFIIVPPGVAKSLGEKRMNALKINQQRLVSILDLHYALRYFSDGTLGILDKEHREYSMNSDGIFSEIPSNRLCDDIPRLEPNVCICKDYENVVADNDARYGMLAEFALGTINNEIQIQYRKSNPHRRKGFGSCQRLVAHHFGNVKQRHVQKGETKVKMVLFVANPDNLDSMEIFLVIMEVSFVGIKLVAYERITRYRPFDECARESGVSAHLCVCSLKSNYSENEQPNFHSYPEVFGSKTSIKKIHNDCLYLLKRMNNAGIVLEAANRCIDLKYTIRVDVSAENGILSTPSPIKTELFSRMMTFIVVIVQVDETMDWDVKYTVNYEWTVINTL